MKKRKVFILLCLIALTICSCKRNDNELIMVTEAGFAPYEFYENGEIVGVDVEIAQKIAERLGKKLVVKDIYFDSIISELKSGKADIALAGMSISEERKKEVDFSKEYISSNQVVIVKNESNIKTINEIQNKKIAVQLGSVADTYVTSNKVTSDVVRQKKYLSMIEDLKNDKVDLIIMDELPAKEIVKTNDNLIILDGTVFSDSYGIAIKKGNKELLDVVNNVLDELISSGEINSYVLKYTK